jgi:hypothetical protein
MVTLITLDVSGWSESMEGNTLKRIWQLMISTAMTCEKDIKGSRLVNPVLLAITRLVRTTRVMAVNKASGEEPIVPLKCESCTLQFSNSAAPVSLIEIAAPILL